MAFLKKEYSWLCVFVSIVAVALYVGLGEEGQGPSTAACFIYGAISSALAGFIGMRVATRSAVRTTEAAKSSLGKALTGGFPLSACVGRADVMDRAWPESEGEAIHTSTFLGHPVGCAMALASLRELEAKKLVTRCAEMGEHFLTELRRLAKRLGQARCRPRGLGLMLALELFDEGKPAEAIALTVTKRLLAEGFILLPEGEPANILSITPPLTVGKTYITRFTRALGQALEDAYA